MLNYKKRFFAAILSILMIICLVPSIQATKTVKLQTVKSSKYDLDGDGKKDGLIVEAYGTRFGENGSDVDFIDYLKVTVNGKTKTIKRDYDCYIGKLHIMDFDKADKRKDITLVLGGEDATGSLLVLQYDGKNISCVGDINIGYAEWLMENKPITDGKGTIVVGYSNMGYVEAPGASRYLLKNGKYVHDTYLYTDNPYDLLDIYSYTSVFTVQKPLYGYTFDGDPIYLKKGDSVFLLYDNQQGNSYIVAQIIGGEVIFFPYNPDKYELINYGSWWTYFDEVK